MTKTEKTLYGMFTESTGSHMLDSGGAYGRHWEKNQKKTLKDFDSMPSVSVDPEYSGFTINTWHYLCNQLDIDSICEQFNKINVNADNWDSEKAYGLSIEGEAFLTDVDANIKEGWNTYNGDSSLSQVLQGHYVEINGEHYVLIQLHQGCDVRGGYTDARLFKIDNNYGECLNPEDVTLELTMKDGTVKTVDFMGMDCTDPETGSLMEFEWENVESGTGYLFNE